MNQKKIAMLLIAVVSLGTGLSFHQMTAHALADYWVHNHWVTIKKTVKVQKIKIVNPMYKSRAVKTYKIHRGTHYKLGHYSTNYPWVLNSGRFNSNSHYTYIVRRGWNDASWFKFR